MDVPGIGAHSEKATDAGNLPGSYSMARRHRRQMAAFLVDVQIVDLDQALSPKSKRIRRKELE